MRCQPHGLASAPDGRCVVCRREGLGNGLSAQPGDATPTHRLWTGLGVMVLAMGVGGAYRTITARRTPGTISADVAPLPSTPPPTREAPAAAQAPAASLSDVDVVVYTASWCSVCKRAKACMNAQGIAYDEMDVDQSSENARGLRALNARGSIPTFDVDGEVMIGFSEQGLVATMTRAAKRRGARRAP